MALESVVLVVGDDPEQREIILRSLAAEPYGVELAVSMQDALERVDDGIDVVISDLEWGQFNGLELLRTWKSRQPETAFVFVTDGRDVSAAVESMKRGADDCLVKPLDPEQVRQVVTQLLESRRASGRKMRHRVDESHMAAHPQIDIPPGTSLDDLERAAVEQALAQHQGNRTHAAKTLGISVRTLQRKLKAWGMPFAASYTPATRPHLFLSTPTHNSAYSSSHAH
jgi:DNA-binding NtrC family response regulator